MKNNYNYKRWKYYKNEFLSKTQFYCYCLKRRKKKSYFFQNNYDNDNVKNDKNSYVCNVCKRAYNIYKHTHGYIRIYILYTHLGV